MFSLYHIMLDGRGISLAFTEYLTKIHRTYNDE